MEALNRAFFKSAPHPPYPLPYRKGCSHCHHNYRKAEQGCRLTVTYYRRHPLFAEVADREVEVFGERAQDPQRWT